MVKGVKNVATQLPGAPVKGETPWAVIRSANQSAGWVLGISVNEREQSYEYRKKLRLRSNLQLNFDGLYQ